MSDATTNYQFFIAGVKFHKAHTVINDIKQDDILELAPEPDNKYDPNAIVIKFKGVTLGYVPMKISSEVSAFIEVNEVKCLVLKINPKAATWEQIEVSIIKVN